MSRKTFRSRLGRWLFRLVRWLSPGVVVIALVFYGVLPIVVDRAVSGALADAKRRMLFVLSPVIQIRSFAIA